MRYLMAQVLNKETQPDYKVLGSVTSDLFQHA